MSKFYGIKREGVIDNISVPISPPYFAFSNITSIKISGIRGNSQGSQGQTFTGCPRMQFSLFIQYKRDNLVEVIKCHDIMKHQ